MPVVKRMRTVPYSCEQMYDLVNDVNHYAEFLPYCVQSFVQSKSDEEVQATLVIGAAGLTKSFTTRNKIYPYKKIELHLVDGPFKRLEGFWQFDAQENGCQITFYLEFEFAGRMFSMLLGPLFDEITDKMVDAFCDRAEKSYATC